MDLPVLMPGCVSCRPVLTPFVLLLLFIVYLCICTVLSEHIRSLSTLSHGKQSSLPLHLPHLCFHLWRNFHSCLFVLLCRITDRFSQGWTLQLPTNVNTARGEPEIDSEQRGWSFLCFEGIMCEMHNDRSVWNKTVNKIVRRDSRRMVLLI